MGQKSPKVLGGNDLGFILINAITWFCRILIYLLIGRAILSWFIRSPYVNPTLAKIYKLCVDLTEPVVIPCRILLRRFNTGMFDFSVLLAFFLIQIVERILIMLVYRFMIV